MFAKLVSATWGEDTAAEAADQTAAEGKVDKSADASPEDTVSSKDQAGFSIWGVASSLADSVKKNTAEITTGLKETNWRAELEAFSKGVREEEHQLRKETVKRVEVAKEHLPKDATAQLDMKRKELTVHLQKLGMGLGGLRKTLVTRTTDLFDQVRDTVVEELSASDKTKSRMKRQGSRPLSKGKYSRLEADISSMQRDSATYCDEPADTADYQAWRSKFDLATFKPAVDDLTADNAFMAELQARIVPVIVDYQAFWTRYFYRLHLLEARHAQRLEVAQRASRPQQEEELAWDDAEEQSVQSGEQPLSSASTEEISRSSSATSETPASEPNAADTAAAPASSGGHTPAMQVVPEESVVTAGNGGHGIEAHQEEHHKAASTAGDESATETVTSSESGSGNEHWTVVKSPSKQGIATGSGTLASTVSAKHTEAPNQAPAPQAKTAAAPLAAVKPSPEASLAAADKDDNSEIDELDDVSNDGEVDTSGGPGSERDEDWGEWE